MKQTVLFKNGMEFPAIVIYSDGIDEVVSIDDMIHKMDRQILRIRFDYNEVDFDKVHETYLDDYALSEITLNTYDDDGKLASSYIYTHFMIRCQMATMTDPDDNMRMIVELKLAQLTEVDYSLRKMASIVAKDHNYLTIDEYKEALIEKSKKDLDKFLADNPLKSSCHGGKEAYYNATKDKRDIWVSNLFVYNLKQAAGLDATLTWNATGEECEEWTYEEAAQFTLELEAYVHPLVAYQQNLEVAINDCETKQELDAIEIDYASLLPAPASDETV